MRARGSTATTIILLTTPILAIVAAASGARASEPLGAGPFAGGPASGGQTEATDSLLAIVPEPPPVTAAGRPLHAARVRPHVLPYQVCLSEDGQLLGRVAIVVRPCDAPLAANAVTVYLLRSGTIVAQAPLDRDGVFRANVPPGVYSVIAVGSGGFAASSVHVVRPGDIAGPVSQTVAMREGQSARDATSVHVVNLVAVPPANFAALECLLKDHVHRGRCAVLSGSESPNAVPKTESSHVRPTAIHDSLRPNTVRLRPDGRLVGRMRRLHLKTGQPVSVSPLSVFLIHDGVVTVKTTADENGDFELNGLEPGAYSVVAIGPDGFAAFDIMALPSQDIVLLASQDRGLPIAGNSPQFRGAPAMLEGSLVAVQDVQQVLFQEGPGAPPMASRPVRFVGGRRAMGGGRSAFRGYSLRQVLLGTGVGAAVGAGVAVALDDDDDDVASPFSP